MTKQLMPAAAIAATLFLGASGLAFAGQSSSPSSRTHRGTSAATTAADRTFIKKAAAGGMAEVELGRLAQQKASSDQVKQFGQRMVDDHSKANDQLKQIAQQNNVTVPTALTAKDKAEYTRLSKLSGDQFDRAYMRLMLQDHRTDVSEFQKASRSASDPQVKQFAESTLPTLKDHLSMAQQTASSVGAGAQATSGTQRRTPTGTGGTSGTAGHPDTTRSDPR